jgi:23S rRNA (uridine2479-2'-O)-methyltransferase
MKPTIIKITTENDQFQYLETLQRNRTKRSRSGEFVVEGVRSINQALHYQWDFTALVYSRDKRLSDWAEGVIEHAGAPDHYILSYPLMQKLSQKEDTSELLAIAAMPIDDLARIPLKPDLRVVVLDRPTSPGNLGTLIRSCDALGVDGIILTGHGVDLYDPETIRAATGSFFSLPVVRLPSSQELIDWFAGLKTGLPRFQVVGTSAKADIPINEYDFTAPTVLLIGNETRGLSEALVAMCDAMVTIPMGGSASSLNIACATSILLYEIDRQRRRAPLVE